MCGRTVQKTPLGEIRVLFETVNPVPNAAPNYNAAPTDTLPVVRLDRERRRSLVQPLFALGRGIARGADLEIEAAEHGVVGRGDRGLGEQQSGHGTGKMVRPTRKPKFLRQFTSGLDSDLTPGQLRTKREHIRWRTAMFFSFPEDARWNGERQAVEFGVGVGEYEGIVRVPRQVFRRLLDGTATPERCLEAYHLQRTRFELIAERKLRNRQLTEDGNIEINGRDLRRLPADAASIFTTRSDHEWRQAQS